MNEQLELEAAQAFEEYTRAEVAAGHEAPDTKAKSIWTAAWLSARASAPVAFKKAAPPLPDPFAGVQKFGMAKLEIGHPNIHPGNFIRLEDAEHAVELDRKRRELHVVGIHKFGRSRDRKSQYKMSDGSIALIDRQEALLSVANHAATVSAKEEIIADLRRAIGLLREESELTKIAKLIVGKYADQPDEFTLSIGAWLPDNIIPGSIEFVSYLAVPMSDWRRYAKDPLCAAQPVAANT